MEERESFTLSKPFKRGSGTVGAGLRRIFAGQEKEELRASESMHREILNLQDRGMSFDRAVDTMIRANAPGAVPIYGETGRIETYDIPATVAGDYMKNTDGAFFTVPKESQRAKSPVLRLFEKIKPTAFDNSGFAREKWIGAGVGAVAQILPGAGAATGAANIVGGLLEGDPSRAVKSIGNTLVAYGAYKAAGGPGEFEREFISYQAYQNLVDQAVQDDEIDPETASALRAAGRAMQAELNQAKATGGSGAGGDAGSGGGTPRTPMPDLDDPGAIQPPTRPEGTPPPGGTPDPAGDVPGFDPTLGSDMFGEFGAGGGQPDAPPPPPIPPDEPYTGPGAVPTWTAGDFAGGHSGTDSGAMVPYDPSDPNAPPPYYDPSSGQYIDPTTGTPVDPATYPPTGDPATDPATGHPYPVPEPPPDQTPHAGTGQPYDPNRDGPKIDAWDLRDPADYWKPIAWWYGPSKFPWPMYDTPENADERIQKRGVIMGDWGLAGRPIVDRPQGRLDDDDLIPPPPIIPPEPEPEPFPVPSPIPDRDDDPKYGSAGRGVPRPTGLGNGGGGGGLKGAPTSKRFRTLGDVRGIARALGAQADDAPDEYRKLAKSLVYIFAEQAIEADLTQQEIAQVEGLGGELYGGARDGSAQGDWRALCYTLTFIFAEQEVRGDLTPGEIALVEQIGAAIYGTDTGGGYGYNDPPPDPTGAGGMLQPEYLGNDGPRGDDVGDNVNPFSDPPIMDYRDPTGAGGMLQPEYLGNDGPRVSGGGAKPVPIDLPRALLPVPDHVPEYLGNDGPQAGPPKQLGSRPEDVLNMLKRRAAEAGKPYPFPPDVLQPEFLGPPTFFDARDPYDAAPMMAGPG